VIEVDAISFSYTGGPPYVLHDLSFHASEGAYVSILGGNGSGKSTLVRLILGLLSPLEGQVMVSTRKSAFVPQANDLADSRFPITVGEMMESYRRLLKIKERGRTEAALEAVGLIGASDKLIGALSGGQKQKVFIARAIMGDPKLLILDEPSAGVDMESRKEIYAYLRKLNTDQGVTILSVEHNLSAAIRNSTEIFHMKDGQGHTCSPESYAAEALVYDGEPSI